MKKQMTALFIAGDWTNDRVIFLWFGQKPILIDRLFL